MQSITGLKGIYDAKEVAIHLFGRKPEGDLARPFKAGAGMFGGKFILGSAVLLTIWWLIVSHCCLL